MPDTDTYNVGSGPTPIPLQVNLGSGATCHSAVFIKLKNGAKTRIRDSGPDDNGSITSFELGNADALKGAELTIQTIADAGALPPSVVEQLAADHSLIKNLLFIGYVLSEGTDGTKTYTYTLDDCVISTNGKITVVTKHISLL